MLRIMCENRIVRTFNDNEGELAVKELDRLESSSYPDEDGNYKEYWLADDQDYALYCGYKEPDEW
jgi:hypothetical protein